MTKDRPSVLIFGGGVAGLTAAHELCERNFEVSVYEARHWGGKVRSMGKPGTGTEGRKDLPGEHGFHFFPTFYKHIPDTMKRIPFENGTVFDNIVEGYQELIARKDAPHLIAPSHAPRDYTDILRLLKAWRNTLLGLPPEEFRFFLMRMAKFMSACEDRRIAEFDNISWWDFIEADRMSKTYQQLVGRVGPHLLIAVPAQEASARTLGNAFIQMLHTALTPKGNIERSLNGPPSDKWADPWVRYISTKATMVLGAELLNFHFDPGARRITGAQVRRNGIEETVIGDFYICAVPLEAATPLITQEMREACPSLSGMSGLTLAWMNGIQFFLDRSLPLVHGHVAFEDSAWALTSVSQYQFWKDGFDFNGHGDGRCREVFSIIISDWNAPGTEVVRKPARECSPEEIFEEVLAQVNAALSNRLKIQHQGIDIQPIPREAILDWFLDPDIQYTARKKASGWEALPPPDGGAWSSSRLSNETRACFTGHPNQTHLFAFNAEPLFITTVGSWNGRPEAVTSIPNFFLASDYVKTSMDFASAEGANEAGRKAANGVLSASKSREPRVNIWPRAELTAFVPLQRIDSARFRRGKPQMEAPAWLKNLIDSALANTP